MLPDSTSRHRCGLTTPLGGDVWLFAGQRAGGFGSPVGVRYPQGGGLTDAERAGRERVRIQAVTGFEAGKKNREIAASLRVPERSVERWRRQWREEGWLGWRRRDRLAGHACPTRR